MVDKANTVNARINNKKIFDKKPGKKLRKALKEANDIICGKVQTKTYNNVKELFKDLNSDLKE